MLTTCRLSNIKIRITGRCELYRKIFPVVEVTNRNQYWRRAIPAGAEPVVKDNLGRTKRRIDRLGKMISQQTIKVTFFLIDSHFFLQGIGSVDLRDEIYSQLCRQLWKNPDRGSLLRGWLLMGLCLCTFPPTKRMEKYLLK